MAVTPAAELPMPCRTRSAIRAPMLGTTMQASDVTTCTAMPTRAGPRRPKRSESGPTSNWPTAAPRSVAEIVNWTAAVDVPRSEARTGSDGRYMSFVTAPSAAINPISPTKRTLGREMEAASARPADGEARVAMPYGHSGEGLPSNRFDADRPLLGPGCAPNPQVDGGMKYP